MRSASRLESRRLLEEQPIPRTARRRMTLRGRVTIAVGAGLLLIAGCWVGASLAGGDQGAGNVSASGALAPVAAPAPKGASSAESDQASRLPAPASVWMRLPPTARGVGLDDGDSSPDGPRIVSTGPAGLERVVETVRAPDAAPGIAQPLQVEYTLDPELTRRITELLRRGRVRLGHVIVLDPATGRVLAYVSTNPERLPPTRPYPAASLMKLVTATATLEHAPKRAEVPCRFRGSPYRLTRARLDPPRRGRKVSFAKALATSNNQCFAHLAVHTLGPDMLLEEIARLGLVDAPAPGHDAGSVDPVSDRFDLGRLGCGLAGCSITPLAAARLAATLADGRLVDPHWIARVTDARGRELALPPLPPPRQVIPETLATRLRAMLVKTTVIGTARHAFHHRGHPLLGPVEVAGKTGTLTGDDPRGRYEWFVGVAPANAPRVAIATLVVHGPLWWRSASQLAAEVLRAVFCPDGSCSATEAERWTRTARSDGPA